MTNEQRRQVNIQKVLREALYCYREVGVELTQVRMLAQRTGLTVRSINRYFPSKKELTQQAADQFINEGAHKLACLWENQGASDINGLQLILNFISTVFDAYHVGGLDLLLYIELERYFLFYSDQGTSYKAYVARIEQTIIHLQCSIQKGIDDGSVRGNLDAGLAARLIYCNVSGILKDCVVNKRLHHKLEDCKELMAEYFVVLRGYLGSGLV